MTEKIIATSLGKQFRRYHPSRPWTLQEAVLAGLRKMKPIDRFWALKDVNLSVSAGRMFGVIGANGSGKSTLLRLLGGVMQPDAGQLRVEGRIGALLELGAGFHPDLTGRENVFVNGVLGGLTRREVTERFDSVVRFAELQDFIDNPLRTYSTGMQMRLAFSTAVHVEPEVLLIDEVLSVGDLSFQQKCMERIVRFKEEGCSIVLVSHDVSLIQEICDEVIWLKKGVVVAHGDPHEVVDAYKTDSASETRYRTPKEQLPMRATSGVDLIANKNRFGSLEVEITHVRLLDRWGIPVSQISSGSPLRVEIDYLAPKPTLVPIFKVCIFRQDGVSCLDVNNEEKGVALSTVQGKGRIALELERVDLNTGCYFVDVGVFVRDWSYAYDYHSRVYPLVVSGDKTESILFSPHQWQSISHESEEEVETTYIA
jgi:lipopolysaccharide transport system ATP-binding protein